MAIQPLNGLTYWPIPYVDGTNNPTFATHSTMSVSGAKLAWIIRVPKTGTLDQFELRQALNTNTPDNGLRFSFQDVDASGFPDGTQDQYRDVTSGFGAAVWLVPPGVMTDNGTNGGNKRSVTRGQVLACVVEFVSFTAGDSVSWSSLSTTAAGTALTSAAYAAVHNGTSWSISTANHPILALKYSDGTYAQPESTWPIKTINTRSPNSGTTPAQRGLRFQVPISVSMAGIWARVDLDGDADLVLYDASDNVLGSVSLDKDARMSNVNNGFIGLFATSVTLSANTTYRAVVKPTTVTSITLYEFEANSAAIREGFGMGAEWYATLGTVGSWSESNVNIPPVGIIVDGIDTAASGGSGGAYAYVF